MILLGAVACFACMDASAKWLGRAGHPILQVAGMRYGVSLLAVLVYMRPWVRSRREMLVSRRPLLQVGRALCLMGSTFGCFLAVRTLPLTEFSAINFSAPLITALLAGPVLGERIGPRRLLAVFAGFTGVLVITRPLGGAVSAGTGFALLAAVSNSFYFLATRGLAGHDIPETTMFFTSLVGTLLVGPWLPMNWHAPADWADWMVLVGIGLVGALGHGLLIVAHRLAPASTLAPFFYAQMLGAVFFGMAVFGQIPDQWTIAGGGIVIGSGLYVLHRERVRRSFPSADVAT
jgi:drug/metabolite transporter (DMT)-like permease